MQHQIKQIAVPDEWVISGGRGVTVAVVDSHFNRNNHRIKKYYTISNGGVYGDSHCSAVCDIISSVAPFCDIIISQAMVNKTGTCDSLLRAVSNIKDEDFDVINFSLSTSDDNADIRSLIHKISQRALVVAAMANNGSISYPAQYDFSTSVSSYKRDWINADIYCDDSFIVGNKTKKSGNSMSTAFVSGIFALAKSYDKNITKEEIIKQLLGR